MSENGALDFERWRKITELALEVTERHLLADRKTLREAGAAVAAGELRVRVLRKALSLIPDDDAPPLPELPRRGVRTGGGPGRAAGTYLLGVLQQTQDGELTPRRARLACQGWSEGTVQDGLERLLRDGLVERPERGVYRLTDAGRNAPPAPPGMLPLQEPEEEAAEAGAHGR